MSTIKTEDPKYLEYALSSKKAALLAQKGYSNLVLLPPRTTVVDAVRQLGLGTDVKIEQGYVNKVPVPVALVKLEGGRYDGTERYDDVWVDVDVALSLKKLIEFLRNDGFKVDFNSTFRTDSKQRELYARYRRGKGNLAAEPGKSLHQSGRAVDFNYERGLYERLREVAPLFGWVDTVYQYYKKTKGVDKEPWHYEFKVAPVIGNKQLLAFLDPSAEIREALHSIEAALTKAETSFDALMLKSEQASLISDSTAISQSKLTRGDYYTEASRSHGSHTDREIVEVVGRQSMRENLSDVPKLTYAAAYLYDFENGVWGDGHPVGLPTEGDYRSYEELLDVALKAKSKPLFSSTYDHGEELVPYEV